MKKLVFVFIFLGMGGLFSFLSGESFYFPECQVQIPAPEGWYAYNKSNFTAGAVFVSNEKLVDRPTRLQTALSFFSNPRDKVKQEDAQSTNRFAEKILSAIVDKAPATAEKKIYEVEGKLGKFKFLEINSESPGMPVVAAGALISDKGGFVVIIQSPYYNWDSLKPILLKMVKNIGMYMAQRPGDIVVYSENNDILSGTYKQRDASQKGILLVRFKKLKAGMTEARYREIMKYEKKTYKGQKKDSNFTPGLLGTVPVSVTDGDYVDIYGVYNRCICEELFYVHISNKKTESLKLIKRPLPDDFDIQEWENFLLGTSMDMDYLTKLLKELKKWSTDPKRALPALKRLENIKVGMREQEYLTIAQSFMIHFAGIFTNRMIPGVYKISISKDAKEGIKREYIYASRQGEKFIPSKKVVILDGKVTAVTLAKQEELEKATLTCARKVVKPGELIVVDFTAPAHYHSSAWVGIIPSHVPHGQETVNDRYDISYKYLKKRTRGTLFFTAPNKPGDYDFRMNESDIGGKEVCSISFTVKSQEKIAGTIVDRYYVSPDKSFKIKMPVTIGMGGEVKENTVQHQQGYKAFEVVFTDDFGYIYSIVTFKVDNDKDIVDYCRQENINSKNDSIYIEEESVETERGKETWIKKFIKGGSHMVSRNLTAKTEAEREPKKSDLAVTTTCFRIGNRFFNAAAAVSTNPFNKTSNQTELVESSKRKLKKFLNGLEVTGMGKKASAKKVPPDEIIKIPSFKRPRLIKGPNPAYPAEALKAHIQGNVTIEATTDIYGRVVSAKAIEGPEILRPAAVEAIKKWQYEPYLLNGVPRPVKFTVVARFNLHIKKKNQ